MPTIDELMFGGHETTPQPAADGRTAEDFMFNLGQGTPAAPTTRTGSQFMRKTKSLGGGTVEAVTRRSVGLFRMSGGISDRLEKENMREWDKLFAEGKQDGWRGKAFLWGANFHRQFKNAYYSVANEHDEYWKDVVGKYYEVDNPTFTEKVVRQSGELTLAPLLANPLSAAAVGLPMQFGASYEEGYKVALEESGGDEGVAHDIAGKYTLVAAPIELIVDKLIFAKGGIQGLKGLAREEVAKVIAKNAIKLAIKSGVSGVTEGMTEVIQDGILNKLNDKPFVGPEAMETFLVASTLGALGGGGSAVMRAEQSARVTSEMQKAGMPEVAVKEVLADLEANRVKEAQTVIQQYAVDLDAEVLGEQLQDEGMDYEVMEYKVGARRLGELATSKTTTEFEARLDDVGLLGLREIADSLGYQGTGTAEDMRTFIVDNRKSIPSFQKQAQKNLFTSIEESGLTSFQKQTYKWLAQGNVALQDVASVRAIFSLRAREAGFDSIESFFEENQGTFSAPTRQDLDLFQTQLEALRVEDNPMAQRAKPVASLMLEAAKQDDIVGGAARSIAKPMESAWNLRTRMPSIVATLPSQGQAKDQLRATLKTFENPTPAQERYLGYMDTLLAAEDPQEARDIQGEEIEIINDLLDEEESILRELAQYNPFPVGSPANNLYYQSLRRRAFSTLAFDPGELTSQSFYNAYEEHGLVGGLLGEKADILKAAPHEAFHGTFQYVLSTVSSRITPEQSARMDDLAVMLYRSAGDTTQEIRKYMDEDELRSADELLAMYLSDEYNAPVQEVRNKADGMVESLFGEILGDEFVESMRLSRESLQVIRGETQFQADGKFVVDLFKGGDVVTLAREFAHVFSPHMSSDMIDSMIDRVAKKGQDISLDKTPAQIRGTKQYMGNVWKSFQESGVNHPRFVNKQGKDFKYLKLIQEELATQFETYLATQTAPTQELMAPFRSIAERYRKYYGALRRLPAGQQHVHPEIAKHFDKMIAGEKALPRVQPRKITVDGDTMTLHLSRPKEALRKKLLQALERVDADITGVRAKVQEYLNEVFTKDEVADIPSGFTLALELVKNNKDALALMAKVDKELAKRQLKAKRNIIREIKDNTRETVLRDMDKSIADMIRQTVAHLDLGKKTEKRIRASFALQKAIKERLLGSTTIESEDLLARTDDLKKLSDMKNPSIHNLTLEQVGTVRDAISDLIRYDEVRAKQHIDREIKMQNERHDSFSHANKKTWQWNTRMKDRPIAVEKINTVFRKYIASSLESPSRTLAGLHYQGKRLYKELTKGREKQQFVGQHFNDELSRIFGDVSLVGVSNSLGPVSKDQKVSVTLTRGHDGKDIQLDLTLGQLMYLYGVSFNEDGLRHLLLGGIRRPKGTGLRKGDEQDIFKFRSPEEMFTAFSHIPAELRQKVSDVMTFYADTVAPMINETSRDLLGVDIATVENYLPLAVEGHARGDKRVLHLGQLGQKGRAFALEQIEHARFLQSRKGGSNPLYAMDMFDIVANNLRDVAQYVGMARPLRSATALLQDGTEGSVHSELARMIGQKRADHLWDWIQDLDDPSRKTTGFDRFVNKASSKVRRGILKLNISVSMSQIVSLNNIQNYLEKGGKRDLASSILLANGRPALAKYTREQMSKMHPTLRDRFEHIPEVGLEGDNENLRTQQMFGKHGGRAKRAVGQALLLGDTGLGPIKRMDAWAVSKLIETMEKQQKRHGWSDEEMMSRTIEILNRTQPTSDPLHTSRFVGQPSSGAKKLIFGVFQSARDNIRGEVQTNIQDLVNGFMYKDGRAMRRAAGNINRAVMTSAALVALIQTGVRRMLDQDDEDENFLFDWAVQTLNNVVGLVPFLGNMLQAFIAVNLGRYRNETNAPLLSQVDDLMDTLEVPDEDDELLPWAYDVTKELAGLMGSGWKNVFRQTEKVMEED